MSLISVRRPRRSPSATFASLILLGLVAACRPLPERLELPGDDYYPESLSSSADGTIFVGSLARGQVVKFAPGSTDAVDVVSPGGDVKGVAGVYVDARTSTLFLCAVDVTFTTPSTVRALKLDGTPLETYTFPGPAFCNDVAVDPDGTLYVADSFGTVYRHPAGALSTVLEAWSTDPLLAASTPSGFGADGIVLDGSGNVYVNTFTDGRLLRIPIEANGSAGPAQEIAVSPVLHYPDGMRRIDGDSLLVVEGGTHAVTRVDVGTSTATATVLTDALSMPTSITEAQGTHWVSEGQLPVLLGSVAGPPSLPFQVKRVDLDL